MKDGSMMQMSVGEALRLSPDEASTKAAGDLAIPGKWSRLAFDERAVWGECQGRGTRPYQVQIDKSGPAFRCSCPSRKFPCKHGLALLLLMARDPAGFSPAPAPAWVGDWLLSRRQRAEKQEAKTSCVADNDEPANDAQASRRETARLQRMAAGLDELERWLNDRVRAGLAQLPGQLAAWEAMAVRMIDAQLPGLAPRLRRIGRRVGKGDDWPARVLAGCGQLRLLIDAFRRLESLPEAVRHDVRGALGITVEREAVWSSGERLADSWLVIGQRVDEDEGLWLRRVWLQGRQSRRWAMLLDFAHGARRFDRNFTTGSGLQAELAFFPGNRPLRALAPADSGLSSEAWPPDAGHLNAALDALSQSLAGNPWQWPQPLLFGDGVPQGDRHGWWLRTADACRLPLRVRDEDGWALLAESGGAPLAVFGEWDGESLRPLSCWNPGPVCVDVLEAA